MIKRLFLIVALACLGSIACRHASTAERPWGQGYETQAGYMQPDHGWVYYWMLSNLLFQSPQPTYHIYQAPIGYPVTYRPWMPRVERTVTAPAPIAAPSGSTTRRTGGFSSVATPTTAPARSATPTRSSGGFTPAASPPPPSAAPTRSSGGFASRPASTPTRSSGGFSRRK